MRPADHEIPEGTERTPAQWEALRRDFLTCAVTHALKAQRHSDRAQRAKDRIEEAASADLATRARFARRYPPTYQEIRVVADARTSKDPVFKSAVGNNQHHIRMATMFATVATAIAQGGETFHSPEPDDERIDAMTRVR